MEKTLIIGVGEIGKSLGRVLSASYQVSYKDINNHTNGEFPVINICYPYSKDFVDITKKYIQQHKPKLTLIHSTIKVGTTRKIGFNVVHTPVTGKHPFLDQGILTFTKLIGAQSPDNARAAQLFLKKAKIKTCIFSSPETTELTKILCTTRLGWEVVFAKEVAKLSKKYKVPFEEVYTLWTSFYNEGYAKLKSSHFVRSNLKSMPGKIGGHCVMSNCDLLDCSLTNIIKKFNKSYNQVKK